MNHELQVSSHIFQALARHWRSLRDFLQSHLFWLCALTCCHVEKNFWSESEFVWQHGFMYCYRGSRNTGKVLTFIMSGNDIKTNEWVFHWTCRPEKTALHKPSLVILNHASIHLFPRPLTPRPSQPLLDRSIPDFNTFSSVEDWLAAIKMSQYRDNFLNSGFTSLQLVAQMTSEWVHRLEPNHVAPSATSTSSAFIFSD